MAISLKDLSQNKAAWAVAVLVVAAVVVGIAVSGKSDNKSSKSSANVSINTAIQTKCNNQIHDSNFCKFAGTFANVSAYKLAANDASGNSVFEMTSDSKGNTSVSATSSGQTYHFVKYNNATYVQDPTDSKWIKYNSSNVSGFDTSSFDLKKQLTESNFDKNTDGKAISYKQVGTEACDGGQCYKYEVTDAGEQPGYMWFDTSNYLLRKAVSTTSGTTTQLNVTYNVSNISEPGPVKATQ